MIATTQPIISDGLTSNDVPVVSWVGVVLVVVVLLQQMEIFWLTRRMDKLYDHPKPVTLKRREDQ